MGLCLKCLWVSKIKCYYYALGPPQNLLFDLPLNVIFQRLPGDVKRLPHA